MPVLGVIPARLGSTRLVHKPLQVLRGKALVVRVLERVRRLDVVDEVVVATDAEAVRAVVERSGGRAVMTSPHHESGTERVAEVAARPEFAGFDPVVNIQGDEPFVSAEAITGALGRVGGGDPIGTAAVPLGPEDWADPARVKVVFDGVGRALYFSRALIPFVREAAGSGRRWQHVGIYAYTRAGLARWVGWPRSPLERVEGLEQLRPLHHGMVIGVATLEEAATPGIDTAEDLQRADLLWDVYSMGDR